MKCGKVQKKIALFQNIFPGAKRKPDWRFLKFRIKRRSWTITGRFHFPADTGEARWLYTDDFTILFLSSAGRHDPDMLTNLVTAKLNAIVQSFTTGNRIRSEFGNQLSCRSAFDTLFCEGLTEHSVMQRSTGITGSSYPKKSGHA